MNVCACVWGGICVLTTLPSSLHISPPTTTTPLTPPLDNQAPERVLAPYWHRAPVASLGVFASTIPLFVIVTQTIKRRGSMQTFGMVITGMQ